MPWSAALLEGSDTAWAVLLAVVSVLTFGAGVGTVLAVVSIGQLRRDARTAEAAESFEAVDLTTVVKRYVPVEHQTNVARQEIALVKQAIVARRPRLKWRAAVFGIILVCGAAATVLSANRYLATTAAARLATKSRPNLEVLKYIQGVWGSRVNFLESCSENPQTIQVAPDRKTLTVRLAKPYKRDSETLTELNFDVLSVKPNMLVLLWADPPTSVGKPFRVDVVFVDVNTISVSPSNGAMESSGAIERCAPVPSVEKDRP
jgi:hypothetical protein